MSSTVSVRRAWPIAAIAVALAIVAGLLVPVAASAAPVALSGTVLTHSGTSVANVPVSLVSQQSPYSVVASTTSTSSGGFSLQSATPGHYLLRFGASKTSFEQYLGGTTEPSQAQDVPLLNGGGNASYLKATLAPAGTLSGTVANLAGKTIAGYTVRAYRLSETSTWPLVATTTTSAKGIYSFPNLEPGSFRVEAIDTTSAVAMYAPMFSGNAISLATASSSLVTASATTTVNLSLGTAGRISGTVSGVSGSAVEKLTGVTVTPYRLEGTAENFSGATAVAARATLTSATGGYTVSGLLPGDYALEFRPRATAPLPPSGVVYGRTFLGGGTALGSTIVHVGSGSVIAGRDIQLSGGATINGTISDSASPGSTVSKVRVTVDHEGATPDSDSNGAVTTVTDSMGNYSLTGLGAGNYTLVVGSHADTPGDGITESTSWIRQSIPVAAITANETRLQNVALTTKGAQGLHTTNMPALTVVGGWKVGSTVTGTRGDWSVEESTSFRYQWLRGGTPIPGATEPQYTLDSGDQYYTMSLRITASNFAWGTATSTSLQSSTIGVGPAPVQTSTPASIIGDPRVGNTLLADAGTWSVDNAVITYSWQHSWDGSSWAQFASGSTITLTQDDLNPKWIRLIVTGNKYGWSTFTTTVAASQPVSEGGFAPAAAPTVTRTGTVAQVSGTTWKPSTGTSEFIWRTKDVSGSTAVTFGRSIQLADRAGLLVTVQEKRSAPGFTTATGPIVVVQNGAAPIASGALAIAGTARVNSPLAAPATTWTPAASSVNYTWSYKSGSAWKAIASATSANYTPTVADLGRTLRVEVRPVAAGYAAASLTAVASSPVALGTAPTVSSSVGEAPSISGTVGINSTVTAHPGVWMPAPAAITYQWSSSTTGTTFTSIAGATTSALEIPQSLLGAHLRVTLTTKTTGYESTTGVVDAGVVTGGSLKLTKAPAISHTGAVYSTTSGTWSPGADTVTRTWYTFDSAGNPVLQSVDDTLDVATLPNRPIAVKLTATAAGFTPTSTGLLLARTGTFAPTQSLPVTVSGTSPVGDPLTAPSSAWGTATPTLSYVWHVQSGSTWKAIAGATSATFTPTGSYLGKKLRVVTSASFVNYTKSSATSAPVAISLAAAPTVASPAITGALRVGSIVTAQPGAWSTTGLTFAYQWEAWGLSGYEKIVGATKPSYTIAEKYFDKSLRVTITTAKPGYAPATATATSSDTVNYGLLENTKKPTVTVTKGVYTAAPGTWNTTGTTFEYLWEVIDPATEFVLSSTSGTAKTFTPAASDADKLIALTVSAARNNYSDAQIRIIAQPAPKITPVTPLGITGDPVVGQTLIATAGDWSTVGLSLDFQWYRNGSAISGATGSSYLQTPADLGATLSVRYIPAKPGYPAATYTVTSTPTFSDVVPTATVAPSISGATGYDSVLTATGGTWSVAGVALAYQWYRGNLAVAGATGTTYRISLVDRGYDVRVVVTASKKFHVDGAAASGSVNISNSQFLAPSAPSVISGTGALDSIINSETYPWNVPTSNAFSWQRRAAGQTTWIDIPGAGGASYTPTAADGFVSGDSVRLRVKGSAPGYYDNYDASTAIVIQ